MCIMYSCLYMTFHTTLYVLSIFRQIATLRIGSISFVSSVCLSPWNESSPNEWISMKFGIRRFFENPSKGLKFD